MPSKPWHTESLSSRRAHCSLPRQTPEATWKSLNCSHALMIYALNPRFSRKKPMFPHTKGGVPSQESGAHSLIVAILTPNLHVSLYSGLITDLFTTLPSLPGVNSVVPSNMTFLHAKPRLYSRRFTKPCHWFLGELTAFSNSHISSHYILLLCFFLLTRFCCRLFYSL